MVVGDIPAARSVSLVISGGTPKRPGRPNVPSPRFTYRKANLRGQAAVSSLEVGTSGPNSRRYRPAANGVTRLARLHWRAPSATRICPPSAKALEARANARHDILDLPGACSRPSAEARTTGRAYE
jgi:hypothetical protein